MKRGIAYGLLAVTPFWATVAFFFGGLLAAGWTVVAFGCAELLLAAISNEPPHFTVIEEQRIGAFDKRGRLRLSRAELRRKAA